jgi:RNA polymerase sigma-70 factor (ECF subfamily)
MPDTKAVNLTEREETYRSTRPTLGLIVRGEPGFIDGKSVFVFGPTVALPDDMPSAAALLEATPATSRPPARDADEAMSRYARDDESAFVMIHDFVAPRLTAYLRRRVREQALVPDLVQQTFLHMHRARRTFRAGSEVLPWAFAIARRQLVEAFRAELGPMLAMTDAHADALATCRATTPCGEELLAAKQAARRVEVAFAGLSQPQRAAYELVKGDGLSLVQAAAVLGTTVTGVKLRTHRAYAALRLALVPAE